MDVPLDLTPRQTVEKDFYDRYYADLNRSTPDGHLLVDPGRPPIYFAGMENVVARALASLGPLSGKRVLVVGSGNGRAASWLALNGAKVRAVDVAPASGEMTRRVAAINGVVENVEFSSIPAESIDQHFEPESVDLVYGTEVLHHLDLQGFASALHRVMAPRGRASFVEPVAFHARVQALRNSRTLIALLPVHRDTPTEGILTRESVAILASGFRVHHEDFGAITFLLGLIWRSPLLTRVAYKACGINGLPAAEAFDALASRVFALDARLLTIFPPLGMLCRKTLLTLIKV